MSIWAPFGTSDFPLNQPMVGQKEFYEIFKGFTKTVFCKWDLTTFAKVFPQAPVGNFYVNPSTFL